MKRDGSGRATARLWRVDGWLRERIGARPPSLTAIGARLAAFGITHVTDATPDSAAVPVLAGALHRGELPQYVTSLATHRPAPVSHPRLRLGARKLVVADHELPELAALVRKISASHAARRPVAVHCVTPAALALTLAALDEAGHHAGDRIEHCALADTAAVRELAAHRLRVITQPTFITRRGDAYLERTPPAEHADLWRYGSLLRGQASPRPRQRRPVRRSGSVGLSASGQGPDDTLGTSPGTGRTHFDGTGAARHAVPSVRPRRPASPSHHRGARRSRPAARTPR